MKKSPERFDSLLVDQDYLGCTHLVVKALEGLGGDLKDVGGLAEISAAMRKRKEVVKVNSHIISLRSKKPLILFQKLRF